MSPKPNTFKIGLFTLIALGLLWPACWLSAQKVISRPKPGLKPPSSARSAGLSVGSSVQLRGVPIGHVSRITFAWNVYPKSNLGFVVVEFDMEGEPCCP